MQTSFASYIKRQRESHNLVVQPRMGFGRIDEMLNGLLAVKQAEAPTIGTLTLDSYTRVNQYEKAKEALAKGEALNGFPIVTHGSEKTKAMLSKVKDENFVIQVRHGTALPFDIFSSIVDSGIDATEGGPVSYCLPYSRVTLAESIKNWSQSCRLFARASKGDKQNHIESFAGCMLGQLCPPSLLIALGILECLFFKANGITSMSLSYAQGTHSDQDIAALSVLRRLANEYLKDLDWHIVMYTYMGLFPATVKGAYKLISDSAKIAVVGGCERLIVKTPAEAHRIPTIKENVASLEMSYNTSKNYTFSKDEFDQAEYQIIYQESKSIIENVLLLNKNLNKSFIKAFSIGMLDVPYCLHQENLKLCRSYINENGYLKWGNTGNLPFDDKSHQELSVTSAMLINMLSYMRDKYDTEENEVIHGK